jgi:hypothetical protein
MIHALGSKINELVTPIALGTPRAVAGIAFKSFVAFDFVTVALPGYHTDGVFFAGKLADEAKPFFCLSDMRQWASAGSFQDEFSFT